MVKVCPLGPPGHISEINAFVTFLVNFFSSQRGRAQVEPLNTTLTLDGSIDATTISFIQGSIFLPKTPKIPIDLAEGIEKNMNDYAYILTMDKLRQTTPPATGKIC
jgi:hypothetical protein